MPAAVASPTAAPSHGDGDLDTHLELFLSRHARLSTSDRLLVAVSGGGDSSALLWAAARLSRRRGIGLEAAHLDHALDPASAARAAAVARLCARLGVRLRSARIEVAAWRRHGESAEAAARRVRYRFLERQRRAAGAAWILTAHHADDQAETLLLRLLQGSGLAGLAGIAERRGRLLRPFLGLPKARLATALDAAGLLPIEDPTNNDLTVPRNFVRRRLIPALERRRPELRRDLAALGRHAAAARKRIEAVVERRLELRAETAGASLDRRALEQLPDELWPFALARAGRLAGRSFPPGGACRRELRRQLAGGGEIGCDQGEGWRWRSRGHRLSLERAPRPRPAAAFSYTFEAPGEVEVPELGLRVRLHPSPVEPWMMHGARQRTGLGLALRPGEAVTVRNRRPGDRLQPLGCSYHRKLKSLLIDRRVARDQRDRLPLLEIGGRIVWVPGVTIDHESRLRRSSPVWLAEIVAE